jgi:hypothetical protein
MELMKKYNNGFADLIEIERDVPLQKNASSSKLRRSSVTKRPTLISGKGAIVGRGPTFGNQGMQKSPTRLDIIGNKVNVPISARIAGVHHRNKITLEILWLLCGLHGKVSGSHRSHGKHGPSIDPEDRFGDFSDQLESDNR